MTLALSMLLLGYLVGRASRPAQAAAPATPAAPVAAPAVDSRITNAMAHRAALAEESVRLLVDTVKTQDRTITQLAMRQAFQDREQKRAS